LSCWEERVGVLIGVTGLIGKKGVKWEPVPLADISAWLEPHLGCNGCSITRHFLQNAKYMPAGIFLFYVIVSNK
jgi:hypothetical protein